MSRFSTALSRIAIAMLTLGLVAPAPAAEQQPSVVVDDPADGTPQLVTTSAVAQPRVDALTQVGETVYAGGWFERLSQDGSSYDRTNLVAFDAETGAVQSFAPALDGRVWALAAQGDSVYIGGEFGSVNGVSRPNLVKVDATTGAVDTAFRARLAGRVNTLVVSGGRLYVGGAFPEGLTAVDLETGADTGYVDLSITDPLSNAWGRLSVYQLAIDSTGTRLVATGNFQTVEGQPRLRLFVADLEPSGATLSPWYYDGFAQPCSSTDPRRIAYLWGVDFAPDGSYFVVAATGQIPRPGDVGRTVCDAVGRFDLDDDSQPAWINYTGGDSVWSVAATGVAVYTQGHFQWLDNPEGSGSEPGPGAVRRRGIGAIDPATGQALAWNPDKPARVGGKAFLATDAGLWVGSDSPSFHQESHRGIAFCPLP